MEITKGRFIAFEGGEGSGKSSAISIVTKAIAQAGYEVVQTREPGGTPGAELIRSLIVQEHTGVDYDGVTNALLFAAARRDHVENVIRPAIEKGAWVVSDRYVLSTIAYQGAGEGLDPEFISTLHQMTTGGLYPDLTIIMDVDPNEGLARSNRRLASEASAESRFEAYEIDFHKRIREALLAYTLSHSRIIDANRPIGEVSQSVENLIAEYLHQN